MANEKIALLRGINVGGKRPIKMAQLRSAMEKADFEQVRTYIQSGNICFQKSGSLKILECTLQALIKSKFGWEVPVVVRPKKYFQQLIADNPLNALDPAMLHVTLLSKKPVASKVKSIEQLDFTPDQFVIRGDAIYVHCPSGYRKTKLTNDLFESKLNVSATTRNWKTINRLIEL